METSQRHVGILYAFAAFLMAAASTVPWSPLQCHQAAALHDGSVVITALTTFGLPCVAHTTQGSNTVARSTNEALPDGGESGTFLSLSRGAVKVEAGAGHLDKWGRGHTSVHRLSLGAHVVWPHESVDPCEDRLSFQGLHFGEQWEGGSQDCWLRTAVHARSPRPSKSQGVAV